MMRVSVFLLATCLAACATPIPDGGPVRAADLLKYPDSEVRSFADVPVAARGEWGTWHPYYTADTPGTRDHLTGVAVLEPGHTNHPAHRHAEEEILMLVEGEGTWTLRDRTFPAKAGDILYAKPWDLHGLFNSGAEPLRFMVVKYNPSGRPAPRDPNPELGEFGLGAGVGPD